MIPAPPQRPQPHPGNRAAPQAAAAALAFPHRQEPAMESLAAANLASWTSHKVVRAAPIESWVHVPDTAPSPTDPRHPYDAAVSLRDAGGNLVTVRVAASVFARGTPNPGDYLVVYADGYTSWSPKAAFEQGYARD